jgi:hypothetical protein
MMLAKAARTTGSVQCGFLTFFAPLFAMSGSIMRACSA